MPLIAQDSLSYRINIHKWLHPSNAGSKAGVPGVQDASFGNVIQNHLDKTNAVLMVSLESVVINGDITDWFTVGRGSWKLRCCDPSLLNI